MYISFLGAYLFSSVTMQRQNADQIILSGLLVKKNIGKRDKDQGSAKPITIPRSPMFETRIAGTYIFSLYSRFADLGPNDICQLRYVYISNFYFNLQRYNIFCIYANKWRKSRHFSLVDAPKALQFKSTP